MVRALSARLIVRVQPGPVNSMPASVTFAWTVPVPANAPCSGRKLTPVAFQ